MMKRALIATTAVAATFGLAATAYADDTYAFRSPSGNVGCKMGTGGVMCEIKYYTWFIPRRADYTMGGKRNPDGAPTLDYGQKRVVGSITCDSETSGVRCSDSGTAHSFHVSRDSYQLG